MSIADIIALLILPGPLYADRPKLEAALERASRSSEAVGGQDIRFEVRDVDWFQLTMADPNPRFDDMRQTLNITCLLNSVRFALQRRHNVMIGLFPHGDRIVWSLMFGYTSSSQFESVYSRNASPTTGSTAKSLDRAADWLSRLEIPADPVEYKPDIKAYLDSHPGSSRMLFVACHVQGGAQHNLVIYDSRPKPPNGLEVMVYDPWDGKNLVFNNAEWIDVNDFQMNFALPVGPDGGDERADAPTCYSVLFIPKI